MRQEQRHGGGKPGRASVTCSPDRGGMQSLIGVIDTARLRRYCSGWPKGRLIFLSPCCNPGAPGVDGGDPDSGWLLEVRVQTTLENHSRKAILFDPDRTNRITGTGSRNVKSVTTPSAIKIPRKTGATWLPFTRE